MDQKNSSKMYEILLKSKRNNIYTNQGLHNGHQNLQYFSSPRPLSAEQNYQEKKRSPHVYLRSKQKPNQVKKPIQTGKYHRPPDENFNLYFEKQNDEQKTKSLQKAKSAHSKQSERNIYVGKNINTAYGRGIFKANYQNLFMEFPYKGQEKNKETQAKRDLYTKQKKKAPFVPSGKAIKTLENESDTKPIKISDPYKPVNEEYTFRAKSPSTKFLSRFQWKPTTQFTKRSLQ